MRSQHVRGAATKSLLLSVSSLGLLAATPALAQDEGASAPAESDVIVVSGIREAIASAQRVKRDSDTVVDVITATDIGALPDRSVSEVLQRIPGVSILRFAGPNDPDHFAVEGSGVVIRGLPFVRSELNGRDVFGANSGGVLGFEDVSPELLGSVVVFKNSSADLIEGGAAGSIDLRTRLPFDTNKQVISASLEANYGDLRKEWSPTASALYSNVWNTGAGTFGLLGNISYSELLSRADGTGLSDFRAGPGGFVPSGGSIRTQEFDRERLSIAAAAQYESNDGRWLATAQFLRSDSDLVWGENAIETAADGAGPRENLDGSDFEFDGDGVFTSGTITDNSQWRGQNGTAALVGATGGQQLNLFRERSEKDVTEDYGFNLKFSPTDNLRFNFDAQYITSTAEIVDLTVHTSTFAPVAINGAAGSVPAVQFLPPAGETDGYFQDPSNYFLRSALDHITQNEADSFAFRGDVEYDFSDDGWLKSLRAGARYNKQESLLRQSDFNWGNISEVWTGADVQGTGATDGSQVGSVILVGGNPNPALNQLVSPLFDTFTFDNYQRGVANGLGGAVPTYAGPGARDFQGWQDTLNNLVNTVYSGPLAGARGGRFVPLTARAGVIPGTPYLPSEIGSIERENLAAYVRMDFGQPLSDSIDLSGNIGLRYVRTNRTVDASLQVNGFDRFFSGSELCGLAPAPGRVIPEFCNLDLDAIEGILGADGFFVDRQISKTYDELLPSLNIKLDLPNSQVLRFAASRTLTRPGVDQLNERIVLQSLAGPTIPDGNGGTINPFNGFVGSATGNADLNPQISNNFDISWEWYFANDGSITLAGFYKRVDNFIAFAPVPVDLSGDAVPADFAASEVFNPLLRNTEVNSRESASVKGIEFAYQQFYDFLPGPLSGLGLQFTYTFIDSEGVANELDPGIPSDDPPAARFDIDNGIFPRISKHNINAVGLYENGPVQARLAYNWRSSFQLTPRDVIFPFASIYQPATGQLDASLFLDVNDNWKIGVQGVNLLDDVTETEQTVNDAGLRAPRNFFRNDRRFTFIVRATY